MGLIIIGHPVRNGRKFKAAIIHQCSAAFVFYRKADAPFMFAYRFSKYNGKTAAGRLKADGAALPPCPFSDGPIYPTPTFLLHFYTHKPL
ncbi:hypothetical protein [Neisseria sp.]|uniref:hypothetical protein n=1 Tax=Neisseria sp. TaxID=192066 RepID=UPI0026DC7673|nr:hypothetical protein [Neisseria sp.]MDO4226062.1 hypothetical protein [Neisseria sp.]